VNVFKGVSHVILISYAKMLANHTVEVVVYRGFKSEG